MSLDSQNLNKTRTIKSGEKWTFASGTMFSRFSVQCRLPGFSSGSEKRNSTGVVLLGPDTNHHVRDMHTFIEKLVADPNLRAKMARLGGLFKQAPQ